MISTTSMKLLSLTIKEDSKSHRKTISEDKDSQFDAEQNINGTIISEEPNNAIINEEISSAENLDNQDLSQGTRIQNERSDVMILYDGRPQTRKRGQMSDDVNYGLELTPDEQAERVNLFLLGFASIILMNAMAVLIIILVKVSKYQDQLVIKSNIMKKQIKGK